MTVNTNHLKIEAYLAVKQKVYHIYKESYVLHMNLNIKDKFPKLDEKIKMRYFYHILCDTDLGLGNVPLG